LLGKGNVGADYLKVFKDGFIELYSIDLII